MDRIEVYTFEDKDGKPFNDSWSTMNPDEAKEYAMEHRLRVIALIFTFSDSELAWDFTGHGETDR